MSLGKNLSSIKKTCLKASPDSFDMDDNSPRQSQGGLQKKPTDQALIKKLRVTMENAIKNECYLDAIFYADKILALSIHNSDQHIRAVYDLANAYFLNKEYMRCVQLIEKQSSSINRVCTNQNLYSEKFRILTAQAFLKANNIEACINVLEKENNEVDNITNFEMSVLEEEQSNYYKGLKHLVLAKAYESQENNECAAENYKLSLKANCENYEAFERLIGNYLLTQKEKEAFAHEMTFTEENLWLKDYYISRIQGSIREDLEGTVVVNINDPSIQSPNVKHFSPEADYELGGPSIAHFYAQATPPHSRMLGKTPEVKRHITEDSAGKREREVNVIDVLKNSNNSYIKIIEAEKYYNGQNVTKAYEIIKSLIDEDMYFLNAIPLYTAILIELNQVGDLYILAHNLVSANPDLAVSWFTVGSYYYLVKKYDLARKYFEKANKFDKHFAACWIAFGHSFAASDESDQALSAYRTAARLFPGCHLANQCIGMEYLRTNKLSTAIIAFDQAQQINSRDCLVYNEKGVVFYKEKRYKEAQELFEKAHDLCTDQNCKTYETILINLGHCHRKQKDYDRAIEYYESCLSINDKNPSTYASLGYAHHLKKEFREAMNCYNKANFLKNDDPFIKTLISKVLDDLHDIPFEKLMDSVGL